MASVHDETTNSSNETYRDRLRNADLLVQALRPRYIQETRNGRVVKESVVVRLNAAYKYCSVLENTIKSICLEHAVPIPHHCQLLTDRDRVNDDDDDDDETGRQSSRKRKSNEHHVPSAHSSPIDVTETPTTSSGGSSAVGGIGDSGGDDKMNKVAFAPPVVLETPINNTLSELGIKKRRLDMDINNNEVSMSESFQCGSYSLRRRSRANPTSSTPAYSPLLKPKKRTPNKSKNDTESPANQASDDLHVPPNSASSLSLALIKYEPSKLTTTSNISLDEGKHVMDAMVKEVNTDILEKILNDDLHDDSQRNV